MRDSEQEFFAGIVPDPDFVAYVLEPESFIVGKLDPAFAESAIGGLYGLRIITSGDVPKPTPFSNALQGIPQEIVDQYVSEVCALFEKHIVGGSETEVPPTELARSFDENLATEVGLEQASLPAGVGLVRSSGSWDPEEIEGQQERLRDVIERMLDHGRWPKFLVGDAESGRKTMRPGVSRVLKHLLNGDAQHVYCHTIDRLSRSEKSGVPLLLCLYFLSGNISYMSAKVEQFVDFEPANRNSMLLAAEELMDAAVDGAKVVSRLVRGQRGKVRRTNKVRWTFGGRPFHSSRSRLERDE